MISKVISLLLAVIQIGLLVWIGGVAHGIVDSQTNVINQLRSESGARQTALARCEAKLPRRR